MNTVALYARFSSDQQREASIGDQMRVCRAFAVRQGWPVVQEYADHAISGATLLRAGFQALMRDALAHKFDVVLAESLDRFSRDQEDTAGLFKRLSFHGVRIMTVAEGEIGHLHVGLKGTMNALYLQDLADKTRRGLRGRVEAGKSGGGLSFAYRVVRPIGRDGIVTIGERAIDPDEAAVVVRIFREFAAGRSPQAIAKELNAERVAGPGGRTWGPSTLHGHAKRGTGILNNENYVGRRVWNRQRFLKDPETGRRVARLNPEADWIVTEVPELRILPDELWKAVKARQQRTREVVATAGNIGRALRPLHLFSGLIRCGDCGSSYVVYSTHRLACSGRRERGICTNRLSIRRDELEARVLAALQTRFFESAPFQVFCEEFTAAVNQARMTHRASLSSATRELDRVRRDIQHVVDAICQGVQGAEVKDRMAELQDKKEALLTKLAATDQPPPLLHPNMADRWRKAITALRDALADDRSDAEARQEVRQMVEEIRLTPRDGVLAIDVKGQLAAMLTAASPGDDWPRQLALVAGAGFEPATFGL